MKVIACWCFLLASAFGQAQLPIVQLEGTPVSIASGQSANIRWEVEGAKNVYITGIGKVAAKGSQTINPKDSLTYTLIAEGHSGISTASVRVDVTGAKGVDSPPSYEEFRYPITVRRTVTSLVDFLMQIQITLQDEMKFIVNPLQKMGDRFVFITYYSQRGYLVRNNEPRIRARRLSYLVEIAPLGSAPNDISYTIKLRIESFRGGERTPYLETDEDLYRIEADRLRGKINQLQ